MSKHTPGPWLLDKDGTYSNMIKGQSGKRLYPEDGGFRPLATFQACGAFDTYVAEQENQHANGLLIAAAPQMYDELLKAHDALNHVMNDGTWIDIQACIDGIDAALKAASGEQE